MLHDAFTLGLLRIGVDEFGRSPTYTLEWPNGKICFGQEWLGMVVTIIGVALVVRRRI
jgi:hypothetical protein